MCVELGIPIVVRSGLYVIVHHRCRRALFLVKAFAGEGTISFRSLVPSLHFMGLSDRSIEVHFRTGDFGQRLTVEFQWTVIAEHIW